MGSGILLSRPEACPASRRSGSSPGRNAFLREGSCRLFQFPSTPYKCSSNSPWVSTDMRRGSSASGNVVARVDSFPQPARGESGTAVHILRWPGAAPRRQNPTRSCRAMGERATQCCWCPPARSPNSPPGRAGQAHRGERGQPEGDVHRHAHEEPLQAEPGGGADLGVQPAASRRSPWRQRGGSSGGKRRSDVTDGSLGWCWIRQRAGRPHPALPGLRGPSVGRRRACSLPGRPDREKALEEIPRRGSPGWPTRPRSQPRKSR